MKIFQAKTQANEVEEITVSGRCGVSPLTGGALAVLWAGQPDEQAATGRVGDVADDPEATTPATVGEVMAADGLGLTREAARQISGLG